MFVFDLMITKNIFRNDYRVRFWLLEMIGNFTPQGIVLVVLALFQHFYLIIESTSPLYFFPLLKLLSISK